MSYSTADEFAKRHGGVEGLNRFIEMVRFGCPDCRLRAKRGRCRLSHIARAFGLSVSEISQLRAKMFVPDYKPLRGVTEYVQLRQKMDENLLEDRRAVILELHRA